MAYWSFQFLRVFTARQRLGRGAELRNLTNKFKTRQRSLVNLPPDNDNFVALALFSVPQQPALLSLCLPQ